MEGLELISLYTVGTNSEVTQHCGISNSKDTLERICGTHTPSPWTHPALTDAVSEPKH